MSERAIEKPISMDSAAVRGRIMESAIELFGKFGVDEVSVRELTAHAGVNLAAVNYHFGTKEALAQNVYEELAKRVNKKRLVNLGAIVAAAEKEGRPPDLALVIESFIEPYIDANNRLQGRLLGQLILKHRVSPSDMTSKLMRRHFDPMAKKYVEALAQACPKVPKNQFYWRYMFMVSTVVLTVTDQGKDGRLARLSSNAANLDDTDSLRNALVRFLVGAMTAA